MLYVNLGFLAVLLGGLLCSRWKYREWIKDIDTKEHKLLFLYPLAFLILTRTGLEKKLNQKTEIVDAFKALHVTRRTENLTRLYWCSKISLVLLALILSNVFAVILQVQELQNPIIIGSHYIQRPAYGEGSDRVELEVLLRKEGKDEHKKEVTVNVKEQEYAENELPGVFQNASQYLDMAVLGENESAKQITTKLNFVNRIPDTSIAVKWKPENRNLIRSDGTIVNEELKEGVDTSVTAVLTYCEEEYEHTLHFHILPRIFSEEEMLTKKLDEAVAKSSKQSKEQPHLALPESVEDYRLTWKDKSRGQGIQITIAGGFIAGLLWLLSDKELDKKMKKRREQMLFDYPEIINKFTLLVNAGMTVKQAWLKIVDDYCMLFGQREGAKRYAYEEMLTTANELRLGIAEGNAYEQYGRRIGLIPYVKFCSLITQNLRKGNKGFTELLMREALEAFEDRKEMAKRMGEEASTRLLAPMMIMLVIVMLIILIPAFLSFRI